MRAVTWDGTNTAEILELTGGVLLNDEEIALGERGAVFRLGDTAVVR